MTLPIDKVYSDTVSAAEFNEAFTACNKVTDQTLVATDVSDFDTEVSNNSAVAANTAKVGVTNQITNDLVNTNLENIKVADFNSVVDNGNSGASKTIDFTTGNLQKITLDQNTTLSATPAGPSRYQLILSGGNSFTVTWWSITWLTSGGTAPTLDGTDVITLLYDGTTWFGGISNQS